MLYAVLEEVASKLNGLTSNGLKAASASVSFPTPGQAPPFSPQLFVWEQEDNESRQTMPRMKGGGVTSGGFKKAKHAVGIYVLLILSDAGATNCKLFFQHLDAIQATLRAVDLPVAITDPDTGVSSSLVLLGEEFKVVPAIPQTVKNQKIVAFKARITTEAVEIIQS